MGRTFLSVVLTLLAVNTDPSLVLGQSPPPGIFHEGKAFTFTKIRDGVYQVKGTGRLAVGCNSALIIRDTGVMLVDSHISPAAVWVLMDEMKVITDKPIRQVVNTHWHFDHVNGNQLFPDEVQIMSYPVTRDKIATGHSKSGRSYDSFVGTLPNQIAAIENQLAGTKSDSVRTVLQRQLTLQKNYKEATDAVKPRAPDMTFEHSVINDSERRIELLYLGKGHTDGDMVVYLPEDKVLITGDLMTAGLSYIGDGYIEDWITTLEKVKQLDFETVLPGHGDPFQGKERITQFQSYLRDFWGKAREMHAAGVSAEEAAKQMDLTNHSSDFPTITKPGVALHGVLRAYELIEGKAE